MKLTDGRLIEFLNKKFEGKPFDIERFLSPSKKDFRDPFALKNMAESVKKINEAIEKHKHILIYGDYDCDGICSVTILYLFLKSRNANVDIFIPNRFENGYGISIDAIEEIQSEFAPDLLITVDLGITAIEEVEILKQEGVDVIVTDHHLPLAEIPDCLVVDPKICVDEYGFDGLCGAGVALKLVQAMAGLDEAMKYIDICSIATVGDIVPLLDENRAISKLGIDKINHENCLKSIKFLMKKLELGTISSYDISFKIVPRLNACGRMDNAMKVVDFLIETDEKLLEQKYSEIESDNTMRLCAIDSGNKTIAKALENYDLTLPSIVVFGKFHEGVIGILASRICHEYNKPTIIFTEAEDGTFKGSGRSISSIDIHKIIAEMGGILENFGGHKMAVGVSILPENFETFKQILNEKINEIALPETFLIDEKNCDILLSEDDFSNDFLKQFELFEPFGCENEKPVLGLLQNELNVTQVSEKAFKHYKCFTLKNNPITAFNAYQNLDILRSKSKKLLSVEFSKSFYQNKEQTNVILHGVNIEKIDLRGQEELSLLGSLFNKYYSIFDFNNLKKYHKTSDLLGRAKKLFEGSEFGTLLVVSNENDAKQISELGFEKYYTAKPFANGQNAVLVSPRGAGDLKNLKGYKNIIFLHKYFEDEHLFYSQALDVFEPIEKSEKPVELSHERDVFVKVFKLVCNFASLKANDELEFAEKIAIKSGGISASQVLFCLIVFMELNFFEFDEVLSSFKVLPAKKMELSSSKMFSEVK